MVNMKSVARSYMWWPDIDKHIEDIVKQCSACIHASAQPARKIISPWLWPKKNWWRIHADFLGPFKG